MKQFIKKSIDRELVRQLHSKYGCDFLTAAILARRGITSGESLLYFFQNDLRFQHEPFLFDTMEDAVDRINDAIEENEKIAIFGDNDIDGVTATVLLYNCLKSMNANVAMKIRAANAPFGLTNAVIDEFAAQDVTLAITVDCGVSNVEEAEYARNFCIDTIFTDHHEPPETLPNATVIIDPKIKNCGYPFSGLSGCAVAYKLATAMRMSKTPIYKQSICLLNIRPLNDSFEVEIIKLRNGCEIDRMREIFNANAMSIDQTKMMPFLEGQQIFVWNAEQQKTMLSKIFGNGIDFNFFDLREPLNEVFPQLASKSLLSLAAQSKIARFSDKPASEIDTFFNIFITFLRRKTFNFSEFDERDLQLVAISTISDSMPLLDENRIFVQKGIEFMSGAKCNAGIHSALVVNNLLGADKKLTAFDSFAFKINPMLNAPRRLGMPEKLLDLLFEENRIECEKKTKELEELNKDRKGMCDSAKQVIAKASAETNLKIGDEIFCFFCKEFNQSVLGKIAQDALESQQVSLSIVATETDENMIVGSMRCCEGFDAQEYLEKNADLFALHGGHPCAAGFTCTREKFEEFKNRLQTFAQTFHPDTASRNQVQIDAELDGAHLTAGLQKVCDALEPFGQGFPQLIFLVRNAKILSAEQKSTTTGLDLKAQIGNTTALFVYWQSVSKLNDEFAVNDIVDIAFKIGQFNGKMQFIVECLQKSGAS